MDTVGGIKASIFCFFLYLFTNEKQADRLSGRNKFKKTKKLTKSIYQYQYTIQKGAGQKEEKRDKSQESKRRLSEGEYVWKEEGLSIQVSLRDFSCSG